MDDFLLPPAASTAVQASRRGGAHGYSTSDPNHRSADGSVPVTDQDRALAFYVDTLGFERRLEFPMGEGARWIELAPAGAATTIRAGAGVARRRP